MIEGSWTVTLDGMPAQVIRAGEIHYVAPMKASISTNASPAKVVTFRILEKARKRPFQYRSAGRIALTGIRPATVGPFCRQDKGPRSAAEFPKRGQMAP